MLKKSERSESPEESAGCSDTNTSSRATSAGLVPVWMKLSSAPEDQELARKRKQLEELSECIARNRAIMAMEQKAKALYDGTETKKKYGFSSCSEDITMTNKHTWQPEKKQDLQPKKSILKKRSEYVTDQPQVSVIPFMVKYHCTLSLKYFNMLWENVSNYDLLFLFFAEGPDFSWSVC